MFLYVVVSLCIMLQNFALKWTDFTQLCIWPKNWGNEMPFYWYSNAHQKRQSIWDEYKDFTPRNQGLQMVRHIH
jgi:hypothetical protein